MGKLYTFTEFAKAAGVSPQYLYKIQRNGKIKDYIVQEGGKKKIMGDALQLFRKADPTAQGEPDAQTSLIDVLREQLRVKDQQLEEKDRQLAARDDQIKDLTESIKANSILQYRLQERINQLEQPQEEHAPEPEKPTEEPKREPQEQPDRTRGLRSWFARFRR